MVLQTFGCLFIDKKMSERITAESIKRLKENWSVISETFLTQVFYFLVN